MLSFLLALFIYIKFAKIEINDFKILSKYLNNNLF